VTSDSSLVERKTDVPAPQNLLTEKHFEFEGSVVAYYEGGRRGALPLLLMHGVGPGASVNGAFASIIPFLCRHFHVFAMDLVGFGGSGRKPSPPLFDFPFWVRQAKAMRGVMPAGPFGVFGHSLSGAIALELAASLPEVQALITTGTVGTKYPFNAHLERLWTFPASRADLRDSLRSLIFDVDKVPASVIDARWSILSSGDYGKYFAGMFSGDPQQLMNSWVIPQDRLVAITVPVTFVHGRNDLPCPPEATSLVLAGEIPHSDVVLLAHCGHAPAMEQPAKVIAAVQMAFKDIVSFASA
jgi:2-hydroxymuconate-semialdehyde hydrolase